jgi:hypothetical protein
MSHYSSEVPSSATFRKVVCQMAQNEGEYSERNVKTITQDTAAHAKRFSPGSQSKYFPV